MLRNIFVDSLYNNHIIKCWMLYSLFLNLLLYFRWVEVWLRKKRQYLCGPSPSVLNPQAEANYRCRHAEDGLRNSFCHNKVNQSLIDVLKTDIECGWSSGVMQLPFKYAIIGVVCILLALHA